MRHFQLLDTILLSVLVPLWVVCFALHLNEVVRGRLAWVPVFVSAPEDGDSYPIVRAFLPGTDTETSGLAIGDQLIRVGGADLRGVGPFGFVARTYEAVHPNLRVPVAFARGGQRGEAILDLTRTITSPWQTLPPILGFAVAGIFVALFESGPRSARVFFLGSFAYSFHWAFFFGGPRLQTYIWVVVFFLSSLVMFPFTVRAATIFPEKLTLADTRMPAWPWLFAIFGPIQMSRVFGVPWSPTIALRAVFVVNVALVTVLLVLLTQNYRRATPVGRRQLKWLVYGLYIGTAPSLAANVITTFNPSLWWLLEKSVVATVLIPVCFCIAVLRVNFFDIDRLISSTATYSILAMLLLGGVLFGLPRLLPVMNTASGAYAPYGPLIFSFVLALALVSGRRLLHPQIERMFFPTHHALEQEVTLLLRKLPACDKPQALFTLIGERLTALWQPECCVVYGRMDTTYAPVFVRGSAVPPVLETHSPLVGALQTRLAPLAVDRWRRTATVFLGPADRAALDSLRAAVVLPVSQGESLVSFICLGPKISGDVYTPTDFARLATIADKISGILLRFDMGEIERQVGVIKDALRREVL